VKDVKLKKKVNNKTPIGAFVAISALTSSKEKPAAYGYLCAEDDTYEGESDLVARNNGMVVVNAVKALFSNLKLDCYKGELCFPDFGNCH
jgi:hypothetical protein